MKIAGFLSIMEKKLSAGDTYKGTMSPRIGVNKPKSYFGQSGRPHPNGEFPFIHRESFSGVVRSCGLLIQRIHSGAISARPILGLVKRLVGQL